MTEETISSTPRRRASIVRFLPESIPEEPQENTAIAQLVINNPLCPPGKDAEETIAEPEPVSNIPRRDRRRSSLPISYALHFLNRPHATKDVRERGFVVGAGQQVSAEAMNNINTSFPNGRSLTIMVATWNTGEASKLYDHGNTPVDQRQMESKDEMLKDMSNILLPGFIDKMPDLIIIATQEMAATKNNIDWEILLQDVIGPTHVPFHTVRYGTLSLCLFLRRDLIWFCTEPEEDVIKFRFVNPLRTKASLALTFHIFGTSFMIINSHFESGEKEQDRVSRRTNFEDTMTKLKIPKEYVKNNSTPKKEISALVQGQDLIDMKSSSSADSLRMRGVDATKACDCVLWAGDMNFRVDMSHEEAVGHCKELHYDKLLEKDEFALQQRKTGHPYADFKEDQIEFLPTYKYVRNSEEDVYDKRRTPSYTDRILYRDKPDSIITCETYRSIKDVKHSDHKPVIGHFRVKLKPGLPTGNLTYGRFNQEVYRRGCQLREQHHAHCVLVKADKPQKAKHQSAVCTIQ